MAKGRKRKPKSNRKKAISVRHEIGEFDIISSEKKKEQDLRQSHHITDLKTCIHFINEAVRSVEKQREKQHVLDKWDAYANCDSVPKPHIPADVHAKMAQFRIFEEISLGLASNWLLLADERSLLSQNIFRKNTTRKELLATTENEFEPQYAQTIDTYFEILRRMEYFLNDDRERKKVTKVALDHIEVLKEELQNEIRDLLNRYTYRVLSTGLYNKTEPRLLVEFHKLNLILHIPYSMLREGLTIQAVHTNFDHVSEKVTSFEPRSQKWTETLSSCMKELSECLQKEFDLQNEIQQEVRAQIVRNYEEYEKKQEEYLLAQDQKKSRNGKNNNKKKTMPKGIKMPKEPQDDEYPDVFEKFLQKESRDHKHFMDNIHNAQVVHLTNDEINLKSFLILGGIYELNYVQTPAVSDFGSLSMVWHLNYKNLVVDKDARIRSYSSNARPSRNQSVLDVRQMGANNLNRNLEALRETTDPENPLFVLVLEIPEYLCYWSELIVCQYEVTERNVRDEEKFDRRGSNTSVHESPHLDNIGEARANMTEQSPIVADNDGIVDGCYVQDFPLDTPVSLEELRKIDKFCVPQLITSFKFNKEIQEDERIKRQEKGPRLAPQLALRKRVT
uniref:Casc1 domain-containing protein n=1 Tax=Glossina pallidipes TaxID=7398 RepID=A0A1B0AHC3_GLOPL